MNGFWIIRVKIHLNVRIWEITWIHFVRKKFFFIKGIFHLFAVTGNSCLIWENLMLWKQLCPINIMDIWWNINRTNVITNKCGLSNRIEINGWKFIMRDLYIVVECFTFNLRFDSSLVKVTFDNWTQSLKHDLHNVWTEFGIVISSRFLHPTKAEIEISFNTSLAGKWIIVRFSQPLNVFVLILCINPFSPNSRV